MSIRQGSSIIAGAVGGYQLNERNVSNCITEIPQDIKLELNNGTLTLKAGSKVYAPNGVGVFNNVTITSDKSITSATNGISLVLATGTGGSITTIGINRCVSGSTDSMSGSSYHVWYDTDNNIINYYGSDGSVVTGYRSLPVGLVTVSDGAISSIDQVFNGFGYIGSTVFALPGVKGLAPNGRNADGSLNNSIKAIKKVLVHDFTGNNITGVFAFNNNFLGFGNYVYDFQTNINTENNVVRNNVIFGSGSFVDGNLTSFNPKTVFHAVDYSDTEYIAHQAMPSNKYVDLTLPASGGKITAPADGYLYVAKSGNENEFIRMITPNAIGVSSILPAGSMGINLTLSVSKGDVVKISYTLSGATSSFRFVYANGAK